MNGKLRHLGVSGLLVGSLLLGGPAPARAGTLTKTEGFGMTTSSRRPAKGHIVPGDYTALSSIGPW